MWNGFWFSSSDSAALLLTRPGCRWRVRFDSEDYFHSRSKSAESGRAKETLRRLVSQWESRRTPYEILIMSVSLWAQQFSDFGPEVGLLPEAFLSFGSTLKQEWVNSLISFKSALFVRVIKGDERRFTSARKLKWNRTSFDLKLQFFSESRPLRNPVEIRSGVLNWISANSFFVNGRDENAAEHILVELPHTVLFNQFEAQNLELKQCHHHTRPPKVALSKYVSGREESQKTCALRNEKNLPKGYPEDHPQCESASWGFKF